MAEDLFERAAAQLRTGDAAAARALFRQAAAEGRRDAAVIHANFVACGVGAPADWPRGVAMLRELATVNARSARELSVLEVMNLTATGDPVEAPQGETICERPHLTLFRGFFTPGECRYLAEAAEPMLEPATVVDNATGRQRPDPVRISDSVGFTWPLENPAVHALNRRIAAASGTAPGQGEPLQVIRYRPGGEYKPHFDAIPGFQNQRVMTMLVWLNESFEGGETWFPVPKLSLKGKTGDALLFRNIGPDGRRDPGSAHAGLPVRAGEKLIASRWIRARPLAA
jgi:prolyl 4-hydroxylase